MPALAAVILGVALGYAAGGKLSFVARVQLRAPVLIIMLMVAQALARGRLLEVWELGDLSVWLWIFVSLSVVAIVASDLDRVPGLRLVIIGWMLNMLVVALNGGMPSPLPEVQAGAGFYRQLASDTAMPALADILAAPGGWLFSLGDLVSLVGLVSGISAAMEPSLRRGQAVDNRLAAG